MTWIAPPTIQEDDDIDGQAVDPAYYAYYYSNRFVSLMIWLIHT